MRTTSGAFLSLLSERCGSEESASKLLENTAIELGVGTDSLSNLALHAVALVKTGYPLEKIARALSWREFEGFCANILRASGFQVSENLSLKKPRRQVDIFASSASLALSVDCKHWRKTIGDAGLATFARYQRDRSEAVRKRVGNDCAPIVTVILTLLDERPRIVDGVAVVSLLSLRNFLISIDGLRDLLTLV
ncbi:MAG: restriction endonuclease [Thaumarchaeota archaeon]|nr:restriction endonuclease [Nitrososphaerota archaeon]